MRFREFKITNLYEAATDPRMAANNALHTVNMLNSVTDKVPEEDGQRLIKFNDTLEKIIDGISKFTDYFRAKDQTAQPAPAAAPAPAPVAQPAPAPAQPVAAPVQTPAPEEQPVAEGVKYNRRREYHFPDQLEAAKANLETIKEEIRYLEAVQPDTPKEAQLRDRGLQFANQQLDSATATFKGFKAAVDERNLYKRQKEEADKFLKDIAGYLTVLGDRVQGYSETLDSIDVGGLKAAEKKKIVNAQQFTSTLRQALFGLIIEMANKRETSVTPDQIKNFLKACVDKRVIDMNAVVGQDTGNIKDSLNPEWADVFDLFTRPENNIFEYSPGTTSGAVGPGEMALSMMGSPTRKAEGHGDLEINGEMYEIKAGKKTGGRLNSKGIGKATTGWKIWSTIIDNIIQKNAPTTATFQNTDKKGNPVTVKAKQYSSNMVNAASGKTASKYNWNKKGFDALNSEVLVHSTRAETVSLFVNSLKSIVNNWEAVKKHMESLGVGSPEGLIGQAIARNGKSVDLNAMNKAMTAIAFVSYHLEDGVENIMFLNTTTLDYTIMRGTDGDPTDFLNRIDDGSVTITSGFNWNDAQQTPTPSYNAGTVTA